MNIIEPKFYMSLDNSKTNVTYVIGFTETENLISTVVDTLENSLVEQNFPSIKEYLTEDLKWRFERNNWTGLALPYNFSDNNDNNKFSINVILLNFRKISQQERKPKLPLLLNILSHEIRHVVDNISLFQTGPLQEIEEEPALITGSLMETLSEPMIEYLEKVLSKNPD